MPIGKATETDAGHRLGITPAIIPGMTLGIIGTTPGTMAIMAIMDTTAVGIRPGITEATIAPGDIGDGMDRDTMFADIIAQVSRADSTSLALVRPLTVHMAADASATARALVMEHSAMVRR